MQSDAPTVSTLYEPSPIFTLTPEDQKPSPNQLEHEPTRLQSLHTFGSFVISYNYKCDRNELNNILHEMYGDEWKILKRDQIVHTLFRIMEHIEKRSPTLSGDQKKTLVFDVLFFLSEKSGMNAVELDTLMMSSMIDLISMIGKNGTILNRKSKCNECLDCLKNLF